MSFRLVAIALAAGLLGGCQTSGGTLYGEDYHAFYQPSLVNYAAREGYMPVAVYGQPFGPQSPAAVASVMRMPGGQVQVPFEATPRAEAGEDGRVVLLFGTGGPQPGGAKLCRMKGDVPPADRRSGKLSVMAAFCHGEGVASEVQLVTPRPAGAGDPQFQSALQTMLYRLLPSQNPNRDSDCPNPMLGC